MIILDHPYVSEFLKQSVKEMGLPVLDTEAARQLTGNADLNYVDEIEFSARLGLGVKVYANSENGLENALKCRCSEDLVRQIDICKDKALFRETVASMHPDYQFERVALEDLAALDVTTFACPFVVKPARGFFSLGVHVVEDHADWPATVKTIESERASLNADYPEAVVNAAEFIVEAGIDGEEYAIDVYYDEDGNAVITNILHHHFVSDDDISDRLYYTSANIMETWLLPFSEYVTEVGQACSFRNFVTHIEVRVTEAGEIIPIEANPLRFAGWCVADVTHHAWGINPYECYFNNLRPDWDAILEGREDEVTTMVIADVPPGTDRTKIVSFDYEGLKKEFSNILELRKIDYSAYPVFAFCFARMNEAELVELKETLKQDFSRFMIVE